MDLTNTEKYYDSKDWGQTIAYQKFRCAGRTVPDKQYTHALFDKISAQTKMLEEKSGKHDQPSKFGIGIHCTHGVNRTGFIIISYLIEMRKYSLAQAFSEFEQSRFPHKIDKNYLIDELYKNYGENLY